MSSISNLSRLTAGLRRPGVAAFLGGRFLAAMGIWAERIAIGWLVWDRTGSTALLGLAVFLRLGPAIVLGPIGGVIADRIGAVKLLRGTLALNTVLALMLAAFALVVPLWALFVLTAALGCVQAVAAAPMKSVLPQIVPRSQLSMVYPLSSAAFNLAAFAGPAAAGLAIATVGLYLAFLASVFGAVVFFLVLGRWSDTDRRAEPGDETWLQEIGQAVTFVARDSLTGPVFALHIAASFCLRPFIDLLPAHVARLEAVQPAVMLGFATSAFGLGAVLGAFWMATTAIEEALTRRLLWGTAGSILCMLILARGFDTPWFLASVAGFGAAMMVRGTATLTLIQLAAPDRMRGRIAGLYSTVIRGAAALGASAIGVAAVPLGLPAATAAAAILCAVVLGLAWRHLNRPYLTTGS